MPENLKVSWRHTTVGIVSDNGEWRRALRAMLSSFGAADVIESPSGADFLKFAETGKTSLDLLMVDDEMKPLDGFAMMYSLRSSPDLACRRVTSILMPSHGDVEVLRRALDCGYHSVLPKPFSANVLGQHVQRVLMRPMTWKETGDFIRPVPIKAS